MCIEIQCVPKRHGHQSVKCFNICLPVARSYSNPLRKITRNGLRTSPTWLGVGKDCCQLWHIWKGMLWCEAILSCCLCLWVWWKYIVCPFLYTELVWMVFVLKFH